MESLFPDQHEAQRQPEFRSTAQRHSRRDYARQRCCAIVSPLRARTLSSRPAQQFQLAAVALTHLVSLTLLFGATSFVVDFNQRRCSSPEVERVEAGSIRNALPIFTRRN
jgi:hypothetical protein